MKKTPNLPVSEKFYSDMRHRIAVTLAPHVMPGEHLIQDAIKALDDYLFNGIEPGKESHFAIRLTISLIKPEIDKAIERSRRARSRRKSTENKSTENIAPETSSDTVTEISSNTVSAENSIFGLPDNGEADENFPLNRRMRRLIEQERKRIGRKKIKPLSGHPQAPRE